MQEQLYTTESSVKHLTPQYQHYFRVLLAFSVTAALLAHATSSLPINLISLITAVLVLAFSFLAYWMNKKYLNDDNSSLLMYLTIGDGMMMAIAVSAFDYSPWASLLLGALLQFSALSRGGKKQWLVINLGVILGLLIGFFLFKKETINIINNDMVNLAISVGAFFYLGLYGFYSYQYERNLEVQNNQLVAESQENKLQAYKLSRYLPRPVWESICGQRATKTERKRITVFFSDIVGFTEISEELEAETLSEVLNSFLTEMSKIINQYNGTVDKFMGDAIMVIFGDDESKSNGIKKDCIQCVSMAIAMSKRMQELQPLWQQMGIRKPLQIRIGINSGYCTVGTFGTSKNLDYTALGVNVNLASRLEAAGKPGEILVSHETWALVNDAILCRDKGRIKAKGFTHPIQVYQVINHRKELGGNQSYFSESSEGFSMHLDTQKIKNYDRDKVISSLETAAKKLREKRIT